jgi:DNA-directed RNA polymerase subunit RPC12/RpoP
MSFPSIEKVRLESFRYRCFQCATLSSLPFGDDLKCPQCGSTDLRAPRGFNDNVQSLKLFQVVDSIPEVPVLKVVTINWVDSIRNMAGYTSEHGKFWETSLSNLESIFEFWFTTASDAWQHYANFLDQAGHKHQKAAQRFVLRASQAAEAARLSREKEEFEARPRHKLRFVLDGPIVKLTAVLEVPKDASYTDLRAIAINADPSVWTVSRSDRSSPSDSVEIKWLPEYGPAAK